MAFTRPVHETSHDTAEIDRHSAPRGRRGRAHFGRPHGLFHRIAVCLAPGGRSARAMSVACQLAAEHRTRLTAIAVIQIPLDDPLQTSHPNAELAAIDAVHHAQAIADSYGLRTDGVILRAWNAGEAIVAELARRRTEVALLPTEGLHGHKSSSPIERYVLRNAPCRVLLLRPTSDESAPRRDIDVVFPADRERDYWPLGEFIDRGGSDPHPIAAPS